MLLLALKDLSFLRTMDVSALSDLDFKGALRDRDAAQLCAWEQEDEVVPPGSLMSFAITDEGQAAPAFDWAISAASVFSSRRVSCGPGTPELFVRITGSHSSQELRGYIACHNRTHARVFATGR